MKRAPLVLTGTACGLVAVVSYHAAVPQAAALSGQASGAGARSLSVGGSSPSSSGGSSSTPAKKATGSGTSSTTAAAAAGNAASTRSAVGSDVGYPFGDLEVKVTMTGSRLTNVSLVRHDVTDPRSQQIDAYALPLLRSQALRVQSARIDGVSGASYTSAAYQQSLQSAIDKLKA
ncbi:MAG: FMN-binding protein [Acidobacteriota bacterium]|nr:FMN-binding protein [Acidobacteriota bacterium]